MATTGSTPYQVINSVELSNHGDNNRNGNYIFWKPRNAGA
jgi:hypothetical protein